MFSVLKFGLIFFKEFISLLPLLFTFLILFVDWDSIQCVWKLRPQSDFEGEFKTDTDYGYSVSYDGVTEFFPERALSYKVVKPKFHWSTNICTTLYRTLKDAQLICIVYV